MAYKCITLLFSIKNLVLISQYHSSLKNSVKKYKNHVIIFGQVGFTAPWGVQ